MSEESFACSVTLIWKIFKTKTRKLFLDSILKIFYWITFSKFFVLVVGSYVRQIILSQNDVMISLLFCRTLFLNENTVIKLLPVQKLLKLIMLLLIFNCSRWQTVCVCVRFCIFSWEGRGEDKNILPLTGTLLSPKWNTWHICIDMQHEIYNFHSVLFTVLIYRWRLGFHLLYYAFKSTWGAKSFMMMSISNKVLVALQHRSYTFW